MSIKSNGIFGLIIIFGLWMVPRVSSADQVLLSAPYSPPTYNENDSTNAALARDSVKTGRYYGLYSTFRHVAAFALTQSCYVSTIDVVVRVPMGSSSTNFEFSLQTSLTNLTTVIAKQTLVATLGASTQVMNVNQTLGPGTYYLTCLVPDYFGTPATPGDVDGWQISTGSYIQMAGAIANGLGMNIHPPAFGTGGRNAAPAFTVNGVMEPPVTTVSNETSTPPEAIAPNETVAPQLAIAPSSGNVILTWPANAVGFTLQSTTNLALNTWSTVSTAPVSVHGQNVVTLPISGPQTFYRLKQ